MKKSIIIPLLMLIKFSMVLTSDFLNAQWQISQHNYPSFNEAYNLKFINQNTGFVVGQLSPSSGFILKTTDLGLTWEGKVLKDEIDSNKKYSRCISICFINELTGFVTGNRNYIFKTTNSGETWRAIDAPSGQNPMIYNDIVFVNENKGYACGRAGYIVKTVDGGENWNLIYQSPHSDVVSIWFSNEDTGVAGDQFGGIYKTTDGGLNWSYQQLMDSDSIIYANNKIQFVNQNTGFIASRNTPYNMGIVWKTTDQGVSWFPILREFNVWLENLYFFTPDKGFAIGRGGKCLYTSNSGESWQTIQVGIISEGYYGINFINENTGFISTFVGNVYKTTTGGTVSIGNETSIIPKDFFISKAFPNPFNPVTNITIELNQEIINSGELYLEIFDVRGSFVKQEKINRGIGYKITHQIEMNENQSGIYFARISSGNLSSNTIKLVLLK